MVVSHGSEAVMVKYREIPPGGGTALTAYRLLLLQFLNAGSDVPVLSRAR